MENISFSRVEDILAKSAMEFDRMIAVIAKQQAATDRLIAENALQMAETDRKIAAVTASQAATDRQIEATALQMAETDRKIAAVTASQAATDRLIAENALQMAETDRKIAAVIASQAATDRQIEATALQMAATDRKIAAVTAQMGGWDKSHGQFAEEYFINSLKSGDKKFFGEQFHSLFANHKFSHSLTKKEGEFDVVLLNGAAAAIIEVKFKARKNDFQQLLNQVPSFREEFPQYKSHRIYLGMAALTFEDNVEDECKREGIAVFKQDGDNVVIYDENLKTF